MTPEPDLAEFEALSNPRKRECPIGAALPALGAEDRRAVEAAMQQPLGRITNPAIAEWFKKRGQVLKWQWVAVHRNGACSCHD